MRPENDNQPRPRSIDGVSLPRPSDPNLGRQARAPEYRYDHELPAPKPHELLGEHALQATVAPVDANQQALPVVNDGQPSNDTPPKKKKSLLKKLMFALLALIIVVIVACVAAYAWYQQQLQPVDAASSGSVRVTIQSGSTQRSIAAQLKDEGLIRSQSAFIAYTEISGTKGNLKAGAYNLKKSESVSEIVDHLTSGKVDEFDITFLPGDTLANHRKRIIAAGYSAADVDAALNKQYDHPALATKPASASLEGYIYGETYRFASSATPEDIITRSLNELQSQITAQGLVAKFKQKNLTLYQGLTLASIIQKEVSGAADSAQVAQVFYKRLADGMSLGADATFVYAANMAGKTPTVDFESPYNTRTNPGLPPGPISSPGVNALQAAANPAPGDFLYFVSGDDGKNYFSRTLAEHVANTKAHCIKNCALF